MKWSIWWVLVPTILFLLLLAGWGALALWFQLNPTCAVSVGIVWILAVLSPIILFFTGSTRLKFIIGGVFLLSLVTMVVWWSQLMPSHDRHWAADVAELLDIRIDGNQVLLTNVRQFDWRSETDFTENWQTEQYDLSKLEAADLLLSHWMGPAIAHTLISFSFSDGKRLVFSLEIRKENHEEFSALAGFFRRYEQVMIAATEQDIIYVRTNVRGEDVYLYRLNLNQQQLHTLFMAYLDTARSIRQKPRFYNSLTSNCTTIIYYLAKRLAPGLPMDYRILLSGYLPAYVYEQGGLLTDYSLKQLQYSAAISEKAKTITNKDNFSQLIREEIPGWKDDTDTQ